MTENFNFQINSTLSKFDTISLTDIESQELLNRQDKKYLFHTDKLNILLTQLLSNYNVLDINSAKIFNYRNIYYDTDSHEFYIQHHNGKQTRNKVRSRYYLETNKTFFEVKSKTNKSKTIKKRVFLSDGEDGFIDFNSNVDDSKTINSAVKLLKKHLDILPEQLIPQLIINYERITLLNKEKKEKITIDYDISIKPLLADSNPLSVGNGQLNLNKEDKLSYNSQVLKNLVIAETKQERLHGNGDFEKIMSNLHIRSASISKYCTALILTHPEIKQNRFKRKMNYINKIIGNENGF